jgi:hydrogenase/urease accessory protein HupE
MSRLCLISVALALFILLQPALGRAHPLAPSLLELSENAEGKVDVLWKTPKSGSDGEMLTPDLPRHCVSSAEPVVETVGTGVVRRWEADCGDAGLVGAQIGILGLRDAKANVVLRVKLAEGALVQTVLKPGTTEFTVPGGQQKSRAVLDYLTLGFEHILSGIDHLLFVLGLIVLVAGDRRLIGLITAFTIGHSLSLSLAAFGWVRIPPTPVDILIASTIFLLGIELVRGDRDGFLRKRPWSMTLLFGFLHGLGFAGALVQIGLPQNEMVLALLSFNIGIELGQLAFVAVVLGNGALLLRLGTRWPRWSEKVLAYGIGSLACYWIVERISTVLL